MVGIFALFVSSLTILYVFFLLQYPNSHGLAVAFNDSWNRKTGKISVMELMEQETEKNRQQMVKTEQKDLLKGHQLRFELPLSVTSASVNVENNYMSRTVEITIPGIGSTYFSDYGIIGKSDDIVDITYDSENMVGVIDIILDRVMEVNMESEDEYIYFDFVDPHELYDHIVVLDAGHGGSAPGAIKQGVAEKNIDLELLLATQSCFEKNNKNIKVYYTRTDDTNPSFEDRVNIANELKADLFISIHNNSTSSGRMSSISGTQVMYKATDNTGRSKELAEICLSKMTEKLESKSKGTVVGDEIYIIRTSEVPVALIEVGFMTNQKELKALQDPKYQAKCGEAIYEATLDFLNLSR